MRCFTAVPGRTSWEIPGNPGLPRLPRLSVWSGAGSDVEQVRARPVTAVLILYKDGETCVVSNSSLVTTVCSVRPCNCSVQCAA